MYTKKSSTDCSGKFCFWRSDPTLSHT